MISVTEVRVTSFDLDHLDIYWKIGPVPGPRGDEPHSIYDYEFYVLRSGDTPEGPYSQIAGPLRDQYMLRDNQVSLLHKWRQYFYKLRIVHKPTGKEIETGPVGSTTPAPNLEAAEIIRLEDMLFRTHAGRKCWLFIARTFGPQCSCVDPVLKRKTISNHKPCFGTGFLGGFMAPIEVYVQIDPTVKNVTLTATQPVYQQDTTARMISFPPVSPDDIIVEAENVRWRVMNSRSTERLRTPIHQELQLHRIPIGDVEYELPVNVDVQRLQLVDERNFTNPSSLEQDSDYSDVIALFSNTRGALR